MYVQDKMAASSSSSCSCKDKSKDQMIEEIRAQTVTICSLMSENSNLRKSIKDLRSKLCIAKKTALRDKIEKTKKISQLLLTNHKMQSKCNQIQQTHHNMQSKYTLMQQALDDVLDINLNLDINKPDTAAAAAAVPDDDDDDIVPNTPPEQPVGTDTVDIDSDHSTPKKPTTCSPTKRKRTESESETVRRSVRLNK